MIIKTEDFSVMELVELLPIIGKMLEIESTIGKSQFAIPIEFINWLIKNKYISVIPDTEYIEDSFSFGVHLEQTKEEDKDETK